VTAEVVADGKEPGSVRSLPPRLVPGQDIRRRLERLGCLPLRPASARLILQALDEDPEGQGSGSREYPRLATTLELDPAWALAKSHTSGTVDLLELVAESSWWAAATEAGNEALQRLWRHGVAVSQAARRLAREAGDADPSRIARAGLLHGLGHWAVAAIDLEWFAAWMAEADPSARRDRERQVLGTEMTAIGRTLAERWGADPLLADAAWLHADLNGRLNGCTSDPERLRLIQQAYAWAERTPWTLERRVGDRDPGPTEPWLRVLIAEVQARCGVEFVEPSATPHEERLARSNARLRRELIELRNGLSERDGLLRALADTDPADDPETWAERAGLAFCSGPGVTTARVVWNGPSGRSARRVAPREQPPEESLRERPPAHVFSIGDRGRPCAEVHLWADRDDPNRSWPIRDPLVRSAWESWASLVAERARLNTRLDAVVQAHRVGLASEGSRLGKEKLAALAEFAAGAGHELNNPLAVIVGRAQLLLVHETDPSAIRSLRAILTQAQRAHRILRDLMYVARPPVLRPRFCQPEEIVRLCLRDVKAEAEARGVRLVVERDEAEAKVWADPDALRHLAEILLRNALEATPKGGTIQWTSSHEAQNLHWTVQDDGRGITPEEAAHLFDPFFCGREAGRGLGLGLPRAVRVVAQAGGELRWHSAPGQGTIFHLHLPLAEPPKPPLTRTENGPSPSRNDPSTPPA
jgi:signal transduction histidine kinase